MKGVMALLFLILIPSAYAAWEQYQNDLGNSGKSDGIGYFDSNIITNIANTLDGMDFQPLVSDLDGNGKNEIVIFSGNYLKIFDAKLSLIDEKFAGNLLGQPTGYNIDNDMFKEIVFISSISNVHYFFAYEYSNSEFNQELNITVANGGVGSGIKCAPLGSTNICVFMDNKQYVHIVNMSSKTDQSYNTSAYSDTLKKIPAIGDIDNDGNLEAVFWFDENNNDNYGIMAFDIENKSPDANFNNRGIVDDIAQPYGVNSDSFVLKGHPVLVDLNNDDKLEIAVSIFYDDGLTGEMARDWYTELFVYNNNGSELFSRCEYNGVLNNKCNDGSSTTRMFEGTNPFVLDSNNDGTDDICFIKDKKDPSHFKNMTINCYNYSGGKILDSEITPTTDTIKTAIVADMNNDGLMEIVTENNIYSLNGSSIYSYDFGPNFVLPADVDGNNRLDLIASKGGQTRIYLDNAGTVEAGNVSILPKIPSANDELACSWAAGGSGSLTANISWYKNDILQPMQESIACTSGSICSAKNEISSSLTSKNDVWRCSVVANNENYKSYAGFDETAILGKASEWTESCNSQSNLCRQSGRGNFGDSAIANKSSNSGMGFEPLAADINNDGKTEIIIFSDSKLKLFNYTLGLIDEISVGILAGQPTVYNIDSDDNMEIVFIANANSIMHFMAYGYGSNFNKKCDVALGNNAIGSGIRCAALGGTSSCFFKDSKNVFYNFNMSSCTSINLTTNNMADTTPTVPSILDYDKDGKLEGLWWLNNDNDEYMGIAVVELDSMAFDKGFDNKGFIDDITRGGGHFTYTGGYEKVKGNPVFYSQDNGGGYEILIAYDNEMYFHGPSLHTCFRSLVKLYDTDGTLLWVNTPATGCPVGTTGTFHCDMSAPVTADADKDGYDDICFILAGDDACYVNAPDDYFYCIDRFGKNLEGYPKNTSDVHEHGPYSAEADTPMYIADMDNDGQEEMIGVGYIWDLNGSILQKDYSYFTSYAPVPVDLDKNKALDLLWTKNSLTAVFLDDNDYFYDFAIDSNDISFQKNNIMATIHNNGNLYAENVNVFAVNTDTMQNETVFASIAGNGKATLNFNLNLSPGQEIMVKANYDGKLNETDEKNNFAFKKFEGFPFVFIDVDLDINNLEQEFIDYIKDNLKSSYYTGKENEAAIKIHIGKNNFANKQESAFTRFNFDYYYDFGNIYYKDKVGNLPYNGLISAFNEKNIVSQNSIINILIYGNEIDGTIAAVKEFINKEADFINVGNENSFFVDDENLIAVKVFDFLHNTGNEENYLLDNSAFKSIVRNALRDEMFTQQDYSVISGSGVNLRLRNLKPNASDMYLLYLNSTGMPVEMPVVLAHGLFSNLSTWQTLASEISNTGRDTWLIEITGGPGQDCDNCVDYSFYNLTDDYVPALLNGVLTFTGKDNLQYVGFSNGCRAALDSLERNKFDSNKVETFVAVGCPGAFNHSKDTDSASPISKVLNNNGNLAIKSFRDKNIKHISFSDLAKEIVDIERFFDDKTKISVNLFKQYYNWSADNSDNEPGEGLSINNFFAIQGNLFTYSDGVVSTYDINKTYHNINSNKKKYINIPSSHLGLDDSTRTKVFIRKIVNNETFSSIENFIFVLKSEP